MALLAQYLEGPVNPSSLQGDLDFLNSLGFSIEPVESGGRRYLVDALARHIGAKGERTDLHAQEKQSIAMAAVSLMLGLPNKRGETIDEMQRRQRLETTNPEVGYLWTTDDIKRQFDYNNGTPAEHKVSFLKNKLSRLWQESNMSIFCDAGTTNDRMGFVLKDLFLPTAFSPLRNLQVCTNGRVLFNTMADAEVCAKGIITGGHQLGVDGATDSIAGSFTEAWLRATEGVLSFGICFIGCTAVDAGQGFFLSDSFEEKTVKEIVMAPGRSRIVVVVADRSKFHMSPMREGFRFSSISPEQVDLIITNAVDGGGRDESTGLIDRVRNMGVPVIEAIFPSTNDRQSYPYREIIRGRELRARVPYDRLEKLLNELGLTTRQSEEYNLRSHEVDSSLLIPTKYISHSMELFLNACVDFFLHDDSLEAAPIKARLKDRFMKYREQTFLAFRDPIAADKNRDHG